jgi:NDP-sugar pyrophosphorylase family protein
VYILEASCIKSIPENKVFHMTDLLNTLLKHNSKVLTYPVNEKEYIDIGQWKEYHQAMNQMKEEKY